MSETHPPQLEGIPPAASGDRQALDRLMPLVAADLRRLARAQLGRQAAFLTLQPTALVNEAYLRLAEGPDARWESQAQFVAYAATTMRRILFNYLRDQRAKKRGGHEARVGCEELGELPGQGPGPLAELLDLEAALGELERLDQRQALIVELRYFVGLSVEETAGLLELSPRTVKREWHTARLWLLRALGAS